MKKTCKVLSFVFVVVLLFALGCVAAFADDVNVAEVNGTGYTTIQAAIEAAGDGDTVTLLADVTEEDIYVAADDNVIIDLGGHTLTGWFFVNGTAEIKNGTITNTAVKSGIEINAVENINGEAGEYSPVLTLEDLEVTTNRHALRIDGGVATIKSGSYSIFDTAGTTQYVINASSGAGVTIEDGTFTVAGPDAAAGQFVLGSRGEGTMVTIQGGSFIGGDSLEVSGAYTISGGEFDKAPAESWLTEGKVILRKAENLYAVIDAVARNVTTGKLYATLADAVAEADHGEEVLLLCDVLDGTDIATGKKSITINLGGKTYASQGTVFTTRSTYENGEYVGETVIKNGTIKVYDCGVRNSYGYLALENVIIDATGETANEKGGFGLTLPCATKTTLRGGTQINMKDIADESVPFNTAIRFYGNEDSAWEVAFEDCSINGYISFEQRTAHGVKISLTKDTVLAKNEAGSADIRFRYDNCSAITYVIPDVAAAAVAGDILLRPGDSVVYADKAPFVNTAKIPLYARLHSTGVYAIGDLAVSSNDVERVYYSTEWKDGIAPALSYTVAPFESNALLYGFAASNIKEIAGTSALGTSVGSYTNAFDYDVVVITKIDGVLRTVVIPKALFVCADPAWGTCEITAASITVKDPTKTYGADGLIFNWLAQTGDKPVVGDFASVDGSGITITWNTNYEFTNAGTHTVEFVVTAANHADYEATYTVKIDPVNLKTLPYKLTYDNVEYKGKQYTNWLVFTYSGEDFDYFGNFHEEGDTGTDAGTYTYKVTGYGNFCGEVSVDWTILKATENEILHSTLPEGASAYTWAYGQSNFNAVAKFGEVMFQLCNNKGVPTADTDPMTLAELKALDYRSATYYVYAYVEETDNYVGSQTEVIAIKVTRATLYDATLLDLLLQYLEWSNPSSKFTDGEMKYTFNGLDQSEAIIADWNPTLEGFKEFVADYVAETNAKKEEGAADIAITVPDVDIFENFVQATAGVTNYNEYFGVYFGSSYGNNNYVNIKVRDQYYLNKVAITVVPDGGILTYNGQDQFVTTYTIANEAELGEVLTAYFREKFVVKTTAAVCYVGEDVVNKILTKTAPSDYKVTCATGGTLTVEPCILEVTLNAIDKVYTYDATVHTYGPSVVGNYKGAAGDTVLVSANSAHLITGIDAGTYPATAENLMVTAIDETSKDVANCYTIKVLAGAEANLIIEKAPVTVTVPGDVVIFGNVADADSVIPVIEGNYTEIKVNVACDYDFENNANNDAGWYPITLTVDEAAYPNYAITIGTEEMPAEYFGIRVNVATMIAEFTKDADDLIYNSAEQLIDGYEGRVVTVNGEMPMVLTYSVYNAYNELLYVTADASKLLVKDVGTYYVTVAFTADNHNVAYTCFDVTVLVNTAPENVDVTIASPEYNGKDYEAFNSITSVKLNGEMIEEYEVVDNYAATNADTYEISIKVLAGGYVGTIITADWTIKPYIIDTFEYCGQDSYGWTTEAPEDFYAVSVGEVPGAPEKGVKINLQWTGKVGEQRATALSIAESESYIASNYKLAIMEEYYYNVLPTDAVVKFYYASGVIGDDYSLNFKVLADVIDQYDVFEVVLKATNEEGGIVYTSTTGVTKEEKNGKYYYVFTYGNIAPTSFDKVIVASLKVGDQTLHNGIEWIMGTNHPTKSMADYCESLYADAEKLGDSALTKVVAALLRYADAAQKYTGSGTPVDVTKIPADLDTSKPEGLIVDNSSTGYRKSAATSASMNLFLSNGVAMEFSFALAEGVNPADVIVKYQKDGADNWIELTIENGGIIYDSVNRMCSVSVAIPLYECSSTYSFKAGVNGSAIAWALNYSVESYYLSHKDSDQKLLNMVKALIDLSYCVANESAS